jgi:soluble lytic murein transglycosylase
MANEETPRKSIIKYLNITPRFTRYIQTTKLESRQIQRSFLKEFRKLTREVLDYSDDNGNKIDANIIYKTQYALKYLNATFENQSKRKVLNSLLAFGKALTRRGHNRIARSVYLRMLEEKSFPRNETLFELLWTYTIEENFSGAMAMLKRQLKSNDDIYSNSKFSFWVAYSKLRNGDKEEANKIFQNLVFKNPLSYYAILSSKILSEEKEGMDTKSVYLSLISDNKRSLPIKPIQFDHRWLKRVLAWNNVYNPKLLKLELEAISKVKKGKELEAHLLSAAYKLSKSKNYLESFKVIYRFVEKRKLAVTKDVLRILFPAPYYRQIKNMTKFFDPIIALSLIRQESGFNRFAKSHVGARGLMQLMPNTAKRFKRRVKKRQLYNSKLNISIGTRYFRKLMSLYDGNLVYSLAAYNAGEGRIKDWKKRNYVNNEESMLQNIENIPFLETRKYVKLIFRNIFFYKMLTEDENKQDSNTLNKIYDIHVGFNQ